MTSEGESTKDSDDSGLGSQPPSGSVTPQQNKSFGVPALEVEEYKAIDSYEAEGPGQVSFEEGDTITVVDKMEDGESAGCGLLFGMDLKPVQLHEIPGCSSEVGVGYSDHRNAHTIHDTLVQQIIMWPIFVMTLTTPKSSYIQ